MGRTTFVRSGSPFHDVCTTATIIDERGFVSIYAPSSDPRENGFIEQPGTVIGLCGRCGLPVDDRHGDSLDAFVGVMCNAGGDVRSRPPGAWTHTIEDAYTMLLDRIVSHPYTGDINRWCDVIDAVNALAGE